MRIAVAAALGFAALLTIGAAAQSSVNAEPMAALLAEVRALRIAMQQSAAITPRMQRTLARLTIEEQRVTHLAAQLDQVRRELTEVARGARATANELADAEPALQTEADEKMRRDLTSMQTTFKRRLAEQTFHEQQLRARQQEAEQALNSEQARWIELNSRLDELERLLAPVR